MLVVILMVVIVVAIIMSHKSGSNEMDLIRFANEYTDKYRLAANIIRTAKYENTEKLINDMTDANDKLLDAAHFLTVNKSSNTKKKGEAYFILRDCANEYNWIYKGTKYSQCYGLLMEDALHKVYFND